MARLGHQYKYFFKSRTTLYFYPRTLINNFNGRSEFGYKGSALTWNSIWLGTMAGRTGNRTDQSVLFGTHSSTWERHRFKPNAVSSRRASFASHAEFRILDWSSFSLENHHRIFLIEKHDFGFLQFFRASRYHEGSLRVKQLVAKTETSCMGYAAGFDLKFFLF